MTPHEILLLRKRLGLNQTDMAGKLMITREYYSRIENGLKPSERLVEQLRILANGTDVIKDHNLQEEPREFGLNGDSKRAEIRSIVDSAIASAGDDPVRLSWCLEQCRQHLRVPAHWRVGTTASDVGITSAEEEIDRQIRADNRKHVYGEESEDAGSRSA